MQAYQIKRLSLCSDTTCRHAPKEANDECIVFHENGQRHDCFRLFNFLSQSPKIVQTASSVSPANGAGSATKSSVRRAAMVRRKHRLNF